MRENIGGNLNLIFGEIWEDKQVVDWQGYFKF